MMFEIGYDLIGIGVTIAVFGLFIWAYDPARNKNTIRDTTIVEYAVILGMLIVLIGIGTVASTEFGVVPWLK